MLINVISFQKNLHLIGIELFKIDKILRTQPPTYKIKDINGAIMAGKYF